MAPSVSRRGARVVRARTPFNAAVVALTAAAGLLLGACKGEPKPVAEVDAGEARGAGHGDGGAEATARTPVALSPFDFAHALPGLPPPMAALPGSPVKGLLERRPALAPSAYSAGILQERPTAGPFRHIAYLLDREKRRVRAVLGTLTAGYLEGDRRSLLTEAITARLGKPEAFKDEAHEGKRWRTLDYRVDLRTDRATGDLELLLHERGADTVDHQDR